MGLKKRNKISAEFSMSSLTDIIFLLLIFFMLTSTLVKITQPVDLPESDSKTVAPTSALVGITPDGTYSLNNVPASLSSIESSLRSEWPTRESRESVTITIVADKGVPFEKVERIMEIAGRLRVKAIIATKPRQG
ncbi:MAG: biopolymer transporter ExbD [Bacteroidetes bacterium]|nr:biopolymer transporter ExbD [Bacteroidota bacterium]